MIEPEASNRTPSSPPLGGTERALLQRIREVAGSGAQDRSRKELASDLGTSEASTRRALQRLELAGMISVQRVPGKPSVYHLAGSAQGSAHEVGSGRLTESAQVGSNPLAEPAQVGSPEPAHPRVRAGLGVNYEGSGKSGTQELETTSRAREAEPTESTEPTEPTPAEPAQREPTPLGVGQAAVGWAVAEQRRLGKPQLSGSLLKKVGNQAKRLSDDGMELGRLQAAVEQLVAAGHTDLLLADSKAQAGAAARQFAGELRDEAAAAPQRDDVARRSQPHTEAELGEALAWLTLNWGARAPNVATPAARAHWHRELREIPIEGVLWALRSWARGPDGAWPPTPTQLYAMAKPMLDEHWRRHRDRQHQYEVHQRLNGAKA